MRLLIAVAGASIMIGVAGAAHADPGNDAAFIASLDAAGITYQDANQAINIAKAVCRLMADNKPAPEVLQLLQARNPGLGSERGSQFIAISARTYCPTQIAPTNPGG